MTDRDPSHKLFRPIFGRRGVQRDVREELTFHVEERIEELVAHGMNRHAAEQEVRARFGNLHVIGAEVARIDHRMVRRRSLAESADATGRDLRIGMRALRNTPAFTAIAVLTLALAIGATTAMFSSVYGILMRPMNTPALDRLMVVRANLPGLKLLKVDLSPPEVIDLAGQHQLFDAVGGVADWFANLTGSGDPQRILGAQTVGRFFDAFAVTPALGRFYRPEDSERGTPVAVLSYNFWRTWGGGDSAVIGRPLELNGKRYEVIGVLPQAFRYEASAQVFLPYRLTPDAGAMRQVRIMTAIGRLHPGVTDAQATARLNAITAQWQSSPATANPADTHFALVGIPFLIDQAGGLRPLLLLLMAAVSLVLLIACANVANLQLVRGARRSKELAVRAALGAGKWPIVRQLLIESIIVAVIGGTLGVLLAGGIVWVVRQINTGLYAALRNLHLQPAVLAFAIGITVFCALIFGMMPALRATRSDLQQVLRRGLSGGLRHNRLLRISVIAQVALSLMLLLGAGVLVRSFARLLAVDPGFKPANLITFRVSLPQASYPESAQQAAFFEQLHTRLAATPGVTSVGAISDLPFGEGRNSSPFTIQDVPVAKGEPERHADMRFVFADYFRAAAIPVLRGRPFGAQDDAGTQRVAIIDESLARQYFGATDPIGKTISQGMSAVIVGVVGSVKHGDLSEADKATVYYSYAQAPWYSTLYITMRTTLTPTAVTRLARTAVTALDPQLPVFDVRSMQERIDASLDARRLAMAVLGGLATLALLLALLGVYGVLSYSASQRTHELGIRIALGARPLDVVRLVVGGGLALVSTGLVLGLGAFLALVRYMSALVYGVAPRDPLTIAVAMGVLLLGATIAASMPARRAARVDPLLAIRKD